MNVQNTHLMILTLLSSVLKRVEALNFLLRKLDIEMRVKSQSCHVADATSRKDYSLLGHSHCRLRVTTNSAVAVGQRLRLTAGLGTHERGDGTIVSKCGFTRSQSPALNGCHEQRSTTCAERDCIDNRQSTPAQRIDQKVSPSSMLTDESGRDEKRISKFQLQILETTQVGIFSHKKLCVASTDAISNIFFTPVGVGLSTPQITNPIYVT